MADEDNTPAAAEDAVLPQGENENKPGDVKLLVFLVL